MFAERRAGTESLIALRGTTVRSQPAGTPAGLLSLRLHAWWRLGRATLMGRGGPESEIEADSLLSL